MLLDLDYLVFVQTRVNGQISEFEELNLFQIAVIMPFYSFACFFTGD